MTRLNQWLIAAVLPVALSAPAALAQESYPNRPVTIVAPVAPGGVYSFFARILGQKLEQKLGKSFVIENRPGAGTVIGAMSVAKAAPDGYTLLMASSTTLATNPTLHKQLPFDPVNSFEPVSLIARVPEVLVVSATLPIRSLAELEKMAKEKPGVLSFGSSGPGTALHLEGEALKRRLNIDIVHVPYKGATPALNDVVGGHVAMMFAPVSVAQPMIADGKVRAMGVAEKERMSAIPNVPTMAEVGLAGFDKSAWFMLVAPAGTPQPIVATLHDTIAEIMATPEMRDAFDKQAVIPIKSPPASELKAYIQSEMAYWGDIVRKAGVAGTQ